MASFFTNKDYARLNQILAQQLGTISTQILQAEGGGSGGQAVGSIATSIGSGFVVGSTFGGVGAPIGAALGLISGLLNVARAGKRDQLERYKRQQAEERFRREIQQRQDDLAVKQMSAIRTTRKSLKDTDTKFERVFSSGKFSEQGSKLLHDIGAMYGYQLVQAEGVSNELYTAVSKSKKVKGQNIIDGAAAALNQKLDTLSMVSSALGSISSEVWSSRRSGGVSAERLDLLGEFVSG